MDQEGVKENCGTSGDTHFSRLGQTGEIIKILIEHALSQSRIFQVFFDQPVTARIHHQGAAPRFYGAEVQGAVQVPVVVGPGRVIGPIDVIAQVKAFRTRRTFISNYRSRGHLNEKKNARELLDGGEQTGVSGQIRQARIGVIGNEGLASIEAVAGHARRLFIRGQALFEYGGKNFYLRGPQHIVYDCKAVALELGLIHLDGIGHGEFSLVDCGSWDWKEIFRLLL